MLIANPTRSRRAGRASTTCCSAASTLHEELQRGGRTAASRSGWTTSRSRPGPAQAARQRGGVEHDHLDQRRADHRRAHDVVAGPGADARTTGTRRTTRRARRRPATRWALAEGEVGGPAGAETYILIANTSASPGTARVTLYFEDGTTAERTYHAAADAAAPTCSVSPDFPAAAGTRFGAVVESLGATPAQIVVERAMYTSPGGVRPGRPAPTRWRRPCRERPRTLCDPLSLLAGGGSRIDSPSFPRLRGEGSG